MNHRSTAGEPVPAKPLVASHTHLQSSSDYEFKWPYF